MTISIFCDTVWFVSYPSRKKDGREQATIDLSSEAAAKINAFVAKRGGRGMKKEALSRLVNWFAELPDPEKSVTLGWVDEGMEQAYAAFLRRHADQLDGGVMLSDINRRKQGPVGASSADLGTPKTPPEIPAAEPQGSKHP